jgi:hypothetical protein
MFGPAAQAMEPKLDVTKPMVVNLQLCKTSTELDCIEAFKLVEPQDAQLEWQGFVPNEPRIDEHGNERFHGSEHFRLGEIPVTLWVELQSPQMIIFKDGDKAFRGSSMRTYIGAPRLLDHRFEVAIRTSWLTPQDIQLHAVEADYKIEKIAGGTRWTFSGKQQTISYYNGDWQRKMAQDAKADSDRHRLDFLVHHLGKGGSYFDETCGDKGFTVESHNAPGAGMPFWDEATKSLNFSIESPHYDSTGTPIVGYFRLWMPEAYLDCKWPTNTLSSAATIQVFVQNEDGSFQNASTVVGRFNGQIRVEAYGFHYSAPKIKLVGVNKPVLTALPSSVAGVSRLTSEQQRAIRLALLRQKPRTVICTATYVLTQQKTIASRRALNACNYAKSQRTGIRTEVRTVKVQGADRNNRVTLTTTK